MQIYGAIGSIITTAMTLMADAEVPIASANVIGGIKNGRHTVEVYNGTGSPIYIGGKDVSSINGIPLATGTSRTFPVNRNAVDGLYMVGAGSVIVAEYFS